MSDAHQCGSSGGAPVNFEKAARRIWMPLLISGLFGVSLIGFFSLYHAGFCDFRAFYCSGRVVLAGADPYLEHPLHECEQTLPKRFAPTLPPDVTLPAPYPGYALALFSIVARLPFERALLVWTACSCFALFVAIGLIARLTSTPWLACAIALAFPAVLVPLPLGQPTLFLLLALATCARLLQNNRPQLAAFAALPTMLDPHVGLAVCLSLLAGVKHARVTIVIGLVGLAAISMGAVGLERQGEYIRDVLPAHALANVADFGQYSTANLAFTAGASRAVALALGNAWYAASLIVGVAAALRLRAVLGSAAIVLVPVAFAVIGGVHTHFQQLELATPAFLLVICTATGLRRRVLAAATLAAIIPWLLAGPFPYLFVPISVFAIAFVRLMDLRQLGGIVGASSFVMLIALCLVVVRSPTPTIVARVATHGNEFAEVSWGRFVDANFLPPRTWYVAGKLPTLLAFSVLLTALLQLAATSKRDIPNDVFRNGSRSAIR